MAEQHPIVTQLQQEIADAAGQYVHPATFGAQLHERGSLDGVLDDAIDHAVLTGTGWIRIRFRALEDGDGVDAEHVLGDWTLDAPDPTQVVEVVTVVAGTEPGSLAYAEQRAAAAGDLDQVTEEETR